MKFNVYVEALIRQDTNFLVEADSPNQARALMEKAISNNSEIEYEILDTDVGSIDSRVMEVNLDEVSNDTCRLEVVKALEATVGSAYGKKATGLEIINRVMDMGEFDLKYMLDDLLQDLMQMDSNMNDQQLRDSMEENDE